MKPKEIEDQIKGLLGLNLGGAPPGSLPLSVGSPGSSHHQRPRNPISGAPPRGNRPRHNSPAPFGNIGGHRPPVPFQQPRKTVPTPVNKTHSISTPGIKESSVAQSGAPIRAPGAYPHKTSKLKMGFPEDDGDKKNRKPKVRNRKRNDGNNSKDDLSADADGGRESSISEIKEIFAIEASKENATENQDDYKPSDAVLEYLAGKYLYPLTHKSSKFPRAKWFCRLCEYHCDNLTKCKEHFLDTRHSRLSRTKEIETTLYHLPRPNKHHLDCLNNLLASIEKEQGLSSSDLNTRQAVAQSVHSLLQNHIPGCFVRLYGSSLSGFGLKSANINLDLQITADHKPHLALLKALEVLQESADFLDVVDEFTAKIPTIKFQTSSGLSCELSLNNHHAYQTSSILKDYMTLDARVRTVGVAFRYWANLVRLDRQAEGTLPPHTFAILLIYFLQQQTKPVVPCIHEFLDANGEDVYLTPVNVLSEWRTQNKESPAELWIELFAFLSIGFKSSELVVSIRKSGMLTNEEKQWKTKRLSVEDPFSSKRNLCRSIQAGSVYDYIADCLKTGYLYFGTIQTSLGSIITRIKVKQGLEDAVEDVSLSDWTLESWLAKKGTVLTEQEAVAATALVPRNMLNFSFNQTLLTNGTVPAVQCLVCGAEGHLPSSCPEEQLPPLTKLPHLSHLYLKLLDSVCDNVARDWEPQEPELRDRDYIMNDLNRFIKKFWPESELTLFGSSSNGFAFRHSDLDISLTFNGVATSADLDCIALIEELSERIKRMVGMRNVVAITSAKVPIVKLFHYQCQIEADISLYNVLARENTRLLSLYADLDSRCRTLGYMVKLFAKICDIGDASRGSLSSYAYILMMIFYLQKVSPPVLPVLQEMYPSDSEKPENIVDGWNAWFFSDRRKVVNEWAGYNRNKMSVGELWIGFLHFYAGEWDDKRLVVSIRQSRPLTKFEKMWNSPCIAIEDPFELSHNLGAGISRKMNLYIKKAFINGRKLFGTPFKYDPPGYRTIQDYFFDPDLLTDGAPPNDRGCRACGKIGHLVADCPRKRAADQRKKQAKDRQRSLTEQHEGGKSGDGAGVRIRTKSEIPQAGLSDHNEVDKKDVNQPAFKTGNMLNVNPSPESDKQISQQGEPDANITGLAAHLPLVLPPYPPPPPTRGIDIGMLNALANAGRSGGVPHPGFSPEMQAIMQRQMAELLAAGQPNKRGPSNNLIAPTCSEANHEPSLTFDLSALAAITGEGSIGSKDHPIVGAINAEDLEASFHTESTGECKDSDDSSADQEHDEEVSSSSRPPPGFEGEKQIQDIFGQVGSVGPVVPMPGSFHRPVMHGPVVPGGITPEQLLKGGIRPEQLRAGGILPEQLRTGAILPEQLRAGGILPEQLQAGGILPGQLRPPSLTPGSLIPGLGFHQDIRQRHLSGDPLGIQSLANLAQVDHLRSANPMGPMMLPMIPLGMHQMGMFPLSNINPVSSHQFGPLQGISTIPTGLETTSTSRDGQSITRSIQSDTHAPPLQSGWPTMLGSLAPGPSIPFNNHETGFPSSVLFPGDIKHPLLNPATPPHELYMDTGKIPDTSTLTNPLPIPPTSKPITPEVPLAEGSPMTPPNLNLHNFDFDD